MAYNYKSYVSKKDSLITALNQLFNVATRCTTVTRETSTLTSAVVTDTTTAAVHSGHCTETSVDFALVEVVVFIPAYDKLKRSWHHTLGWLCENWWVCRRVSGN